MALRLFKKRVDTFDYEASRTCKVCNNAFKGRYCNVCGEKIIEPDERSIRSFLKELFGAFTSLEGKLISSLILLVRRPGQLSKNISNGQRVPYMKMMSLFLVTNSFYFFFPVFDSYNSSLQTQMNNLGRHSDRVTAIVEKYVSEKKISIGEFEKQYNEQSTNLSKTLIIILVVMFSLGSAVINYSKGKFFFDHLLFSLEFYSFQILLNLVILANVFVYIIRTAFRLGWNWNFLLSDNFFTILGTLTLMYWLFFAERNFFNQKWYWSIPKAILLLTVMIKSVDIYRMMLFYITMETL